MVGISMRMSKVLLLPFILTYATALFNFVPDHTRDDH